MPTIAATTSEAKDTIGSASRRDKFSWSPFSHGPRHCIGQEFALLEARSLLSQILIRYKYQHTTLHLASHVAVHLVIRAVHDRLRYRFTLAPNQDVKARVGVVLRPSKPIMMTVSRR